MVLKERSGELGEEKDVDEIRWRARISRSLESDHYILRGKESEDQADSYTKSRKWKEESEKKKEEEEKRLTILNNPGPVCLTLKFSSSNTPPP